MGRLLSPNEAKFWLMDYAAPTNSVVVLRSRNRIDIEPLQHPGEFVLPIVTLDKHSRPRWTDSDAVGTVTETQGDQQAWLQTAERLMDVQVGTEGFPPWCAEVIQHGDAGSTLVFAVNHALTDYRTGKWVAHCFLQGRYPGAVAPACEELLPETMYGRADAEELIRQWWLSRATARWDAIGLERLASFLPPPCPSQLAAWCFTADQTAAFQARCEREGVTLNGAVAVAMRDALGIRRIAHSIDMSRFTKPPLDDAPGLAISHLFTELGADDFWTEARNVRALIFEQVMAGAASDAMLILPGALLLPHFDLSTGAAEVTITGAPTLNRADQAYAGYAMQLVVGSARGGGNVVMLSYEEGCLQLVSSCPRGREPLALEAVAESLLAAVD